MSQQRSQPCPIPNTTAPTMKPCGISFLWVFAWNQRIVCKSEERLLKTIIQMTHLTCCLNTHRNVSYCTKQRMLGILLQDCRTFYHWKSHLSQNTLIWWHRDQMKRGLEGHCFSMWTNGYSHILLCFARGNMRVLHSFTANPDMPFPRGCYSVRWQNTENMPELQSSSEVTGHEKISYLGT